MHRLNKWRISLKVYLCRRPYRRAIKGYGILDWQYFHVEACHDIASRQAAPDNNVFVSCWWGLGQQLDVLLKPPLFPGCEWKCIIIKVNNRKNRKKKKKVTISESSPDCSDSYRIMRTVWRSGFLSFNILSPISISMRRGLRSYAYI